MTEHTHTPEVVDPDREDHLLEHSYDDIQEYDNPLPRWWVALFWATIAFSVAYVVYFHFGPGPLALERYDAAMVEFYDIQAAKLLELGEIDEVMLAGLLDEESMVNTGEKIFQSKCATCHGMFGEGGIGPNLTDDHWIHGPQMEDIYRTITKGVPEKGMLAWERQLRPAQILAVSSYVGNLQATDPPNQKPPEGEPAVRQPPAPASEEAGDDTQQAADDESESETADPETAT